MSDEASSNRFESVLDAVERAATEILDEAEAEANRRVAEAEARAERIARQKAEEVSRVTDAMLAHARTVNQRADELLSAIDDAMRELGEASPSAAGQPSESIGTRTEEGGSPAERGPATPLVSSEKPAEAVGSQGAAKETPEREPIRALRERFNQLGRPPRQLSRPAPAPTPTEPATEAPSAPQRARPSTPSGRGQVSEGAVLLATQMAVAGGSREQIEERLRNDFGIEDPGAILDGLNG